MKPLVSMVMALCQEDDIDHFRAALNSLFVQTYDNIEYIVVVDGPVDDQKNNVLEEAKVLNQLVVLRMDNNLGPAAARNTAFKVAGGQYIAIMDADDISRRDRIEKQLSYIEDNCLDLISCSLDVIDNEGVVTGERLVPVSVAQVIRLAPFRCPIHNTAVLGKALLLKKYLYNEKFRVAEDYDLWVRMLMDGCKLGNTSKKLVLYRQSSDAISKRVGWRYAYNDLVVKWNARKLVMWYLRPIFILFLFLSSLVRLLPTNAFYFLYSMRDIVFSHLVRK